MPQQPPAPAHPVVVLSRQPGVRGGWALALFHEPTFAMTLGSETLTCSRELGGVLLVSSQHVSGRDEHLAGDDDHGWEVRRGVITDIGGHVELVWFQNEDDTTSRHLSTRSLVAITAMRSSDTPQTRGVLCDVLEEDGALVEAQYVRLEAALQDRPDDFAAKLVLFRTLGVMVGTTFRYLVGRDVAGCVGLRWTFRCPRTWDELDDTEDPEARSCAACTQLVVRATTEAHATALGRRGVCVSLQLPELEDQWEGEVAGPED